MTTPTKKPNRLLLLAPYPPIELLWSLPAIRAYLDRKKEELKYERVALCCPQYPHMQELLTQVADEVIPCPMNWIQHDMSEATRNSSMAMLADRYRKVVSLPSTAAIAKSCLEKRYHFAQGVFDYLGEHMQNCEKATDLAWLNPYHGIHLNWRQRANLLTVIPRINEGIVFDLPPKRWSELIEKLSSGNFPTYVPMPFLPDGIDLTGEDTLCLNTQSLWDMLPYLYRSFAVVGEESWLTHFCKGLRIPVVVLGREADRYDHFVVPATREYFIPTSAHTVDDATYQCCLLLARSLG